MTAGAQASPLNRLAANLEELGLGAMAPVVPDYVRLVADGEKDLVTALLEITDAQLMNIITEARDRSEYDYDVTVSGTDKILTLSTCSYKYGRRKDVRFVVMAKLLEEDAPLQASASLVVNADKKTVE